MVELMGPRRVFPDLKANNSMYLCWFCFFLIHSSKLYFNYICIEEIGRTAGGGRYRPIKGTQIPPLCPRDQRELPVLCNLPHPN